MLSEKMQQFWNSILNTKNFFINKSYKCKICAIALLVLLCFTGCEKQRDDIEKISEEDTEEFQICMEAEEAAKTFVDIYVKEKDELNTLEVKRKIINCLKEQGYTAIDRDNRIDMVNGECVEKFCEAATAEQRANVDIFVLLDEGRIMQYRLESIQGKMNVCLCQVEWEDDIPYAKYYDEYEAYTWKYTEKGYLFIEEYHPQGFDGAPGETGFRVKPLDEECRELNEKYVMPLGVVCSKRLLNHTVWKSLRTHNLT